MRYLQNLLLLFLASPIISRVLGCSCTPGSGGTCPTPIGSTLNCGFGACFGATIENCENLECAALFACRGATINNVTNVNCAGQRACEDTTMTDVTNVVCVGEDACNGANIGTVANPAAMVTCGFSTITPSLGCVDYAVGGDLSTAIEVIADNDDATVNGTWTEYFNNDSTNGSYLRQPKSMGLQ